MIWKSFLKLLLNIKAHHFNGSMFQEAGPIHLQSRRAKVT